MFAKSTEEVVEEVEVEKAEECSNSNEPTQTAVPQKLFYK